MQAHLLLYSGTPLLGTPWGPGVKCPVYLEWFPLFTGVIEKTHLGHSKVSFLQRCRVSFKGLGVPLSTTHSHM